MHYWLTLICMQARQRSQRQGSLKAANAAPARAYAETCPRRGAGSGATPSIRCNITHATVQRSGPAACPPKNLQCKSLHYLHPASVIATPYSSRAVPPVVTSAQRFKGAGCEGMSKRGLQQLIKKDWLQMGKRLRPSTYCYWLALMFLSHASLLYNDTGIDQTGGVCAARHRRVPFV